VKSVVLIGATQGTGRQLAAEYARQGAHVTITGRSAERAAEVAGELSKDVPGTVTGLPLDLTRPADIAGQLAPIERVDRLAKDYPYPGSTTVSAANSAVTGLIRTLSVELAPVRINAIHPGLIEDSPFWEGNTAAAQIIDGFRRTTLTGRLGSIEDIVGACVFLLENPMVNGIDLALDGGHP
jgi:NAD(P)-dependent dehydrogenase (short-subunit alcohol dehydrogenase family)